VFHNTFDWTAIGTLGLALATGVSLAFGWRSLRQTQKQIELSQSHLEETQREIALSRREVEEAHRPVLVPVVSDRRLDLGSVGEYARAPAMIGNALMVPIKNIGAGPALRVLASVTLLDAEGRQSAADTTLRSSREIAGIEVGAIVPLWIDGTHWTTSASFAIEVTYSDVAGQNWHTEACYLNEQRAYDGLDIKRQMPAENSEPE
jgi:hypothetical protein